MKFIDKKVRLSFIIVKFKNNSMKYIFRYHPMLMSDPLNDLGCLLTEKIDLQAPGSYLTWLSKRQFLLYKLY